MSSLVLWQHFNSSDATKYTAHHPQKSSKSRKINSQQKSIPERQRWRERESERGRKEESAASASYKLWTCAGVHSMRARQLRWQMWHTLHRRKYHRKQGPTFLLQTPSRSSWELVIHVFAAVPLLVVVYYCSCLRRCPFFIHHLPYLLRTCSSHYPGWKRRKEEAAPSSPAPRLDPAYCSLCCVD